MNELARFNPLEESLFNLVPTLLRPVAGNRGSWQGPRMDVAETDNAYRLAIDLPGVSKEAIQVSVYENTATIAVDQPAEESAEGDNTLWLMRERLSGRISRSVTLPEPVDDTASEA